MKNLHAKLLLLGTILVALVVIFGDRREQQRRHEQESQKTSPSPFWRKGEHAPVVKPGSQSSLGASGSYRARLKGFGEEDEVANFANGWSLQDTDYENRHWF